PRRTRQPTKPSATANGNTVCSPWLPDGALGGSTPPFSPDLTPPTRSLYCTTLARVSCYMRRLRTFRVSPAILEVGIMAKSRTDQHVQRFYVSWVDPLRDPWPAGDFGDAAAEIWGGEGLKKRPD